jgi:DNA polymerase I-like protein with 3'-5' exonuclease and polymerase domains
MGTQLQNIPEYLKKAMRAEEGYLLIDTDKSQSEARCTAYLAASESLREALENPPEIAGVKDFYCYTGYRFFGIEFDKAHDLRQAVKKIIHGTNYIMGWATFIDSVGLEKLLHYRKLVGFKGTIKEFAIHCLALYHELYPEVKEGWETTVKEVATTGKIVTPDGWTRIILGDIVHSHAVMRSCVAHKSQHFSVVGINRAFWELFYYVQVPSKGEYRLKGQIHDSIVSQAIEGKAKEYAKKQEEIMDIEQETPFGVMRIPLETDISYYWKK